MAKDKITRAQIQEIRTLTRRANRRIERATGGQKRALQHYAGGVKFSAATKGLSSQQGQAQIEKLKRFLDSPATTIKGWRRIKRENVRKANETLQNMGYDLMDEELADILEQLEDNSRTNFYRAVNLVEAAKQEAGEDWEGSEEQIQEAIMEKATAQQALEEALNARKQRAIEEKKGRLRVSLGVQKGKNPRKKR